MQIDTITQPKKGDLALVQGHPVTVAYRVEAYSEVIMGKSFEEICVELEMAKEALSEIAGYSCNCQECAQEMVKTAKKALLDIE